MNQHKVNNKIKFSHHPVSLSILVLILSLYFMQAYAEEPIDLPDIEREYGDLCDQIEERKDGRYVGIPSKFAVTVYLIGIGEIDREVGSYEMDFWLYVSPIEEDDPSDFCVYLRDDYDPFFFPNGRDVEYSSQSWEPDFYQARVIGTFFDEMDFQDYPFEKLNLSVRVESNAEFPKYNITHTVFDEQSSSIKIDKAAVVPGWTIKPHSVKVKEHVYFSEEKPRYYIPSEDGEVGITSEASSQYIATFTVERSPYGQFLKNIFPVILITSFCLVSFWLPQDYITKIELNAIFLVTLVFFIQVVMESVPPTGYLTIFDKIMLISYSVMAISILSPAIQLRMDAVHKDDVMIKKVNRYSLYAIAIIVIIGIPFIF